MVSVALTAKQERFVQEYLVDLNATQAAIRAGYSRKTAYSIGQENLRKPEISKEIQVKMEKRSDRTQITQDYVLNKLKAIADQDASDGQDSELKYASQLKALELLGKHLGMFTDRMKVEGNVPVVIVGDEQLED